MTQDKVDSIGELLAVRKFVRDVGMAPSTHWRWVQRGWLPAPLNIAGRKYHRRQDILNFVRRAAEGEFASNIKPLCPARRKQP